MSATATQVGKNARDALAARVSAVTEADFDVLALDIFGHQFTYNQIYRDYCRLLGKSPHNVREPADIPFLPIALFKHYTLQTNAWTPEVVYESSTTSGQQPGRHSIRSLAFYHQVCRRGFASVFARDVQDFVWLALLPSYIERPTSSLIAMVSQFIATGKPGSGFMTMDTVTDELQKADAGKDQVAFIGVSFALLDLIEKQRMSLHNTLVFETGGMKGRRTEPTRAGLHALLCDGFGVSRIYSEYGMTELLSQAWSKGEGIFHPAPGLRILIRDISDPLSICTEHTRGAINCIDLANLDTCAFLATDDLGLLHEGGAFEVLGRFDASEIRGCNLMVDQLR